MCNIINFHLSFTKFSLVSKMKMISFDFIFFNARRMKNRVKRSRSSNKDPMNSNHRRLEI